MKLTVLGNASHYLAPLSGGSSYLVEDGDTRILLDAGGGARAALEALAVERLDAIVLSHFHFDHAQDLVTLTSALDAQSTLIIPPGERKRLAALATAYVFGGGFVLDGPIVEAGDPLSIGGLELSFARTQHSAPSFATRVGGLVYASDTAPCDTLRSLARGAEMLLMHTLLPTVDTGSEHARNHCTAETAGALAEEVGARRLLLSHRFHESGDGAMREAAGARFAAVELARDGGVSEL